MSDATSTMLPELGDVADVQHAALHRDDTDAARWEAIQVLGAAHAGDWAWLSARAPDGVI